MYLVNINSCGASLEAISSCIQSQINEVEIQNPILPLPPPNITEDSARFKYIDDMTLCQAVNMSSLEQIDWDMERPLNYRDRTLHYLPNYKNKLQKTMNDIHKFCEIQKISINQNKTKTVVFSSAILKDFSPNISNNDGKIYQNVEHFKLLGVDIESDRRKGVNLNTYVNNCIKKAYTNLWALRRLAELGVSKEYLLLTYESKIRCHVEQNCPLWMFSITQELKNKIEKVQKISFFIILGKYANKEYSYNLALLNSVSLDERRQAIAENLAKKILKHPAHRNIFMFSEKSNMRSGKHVIIPRIRTTRYLNTTVPSLGTIINKKLRHKI